MKWSQQAAIRARQIETNFKGNLRGVADSFAAHQEATSVSPSHVNRAFEAIANVGLTRRRWIDRPESIAGIGAFLIGFAFSCPDVVGAILPEKYGSWIAPTLLLTLFVVGVVFCAIGWYMGKLPAAPTEKPSRRTQVRRIAVVVLYVVGATLLFYQLYVRFADWMIEVPVPPLPLGP